MMTEKKRSLSSLVESTDQIHLTVYLRNRGNIEDLKNQIDQCLIEAKERLEPVLGQEDQKAFLQPVVALLNDADTLKRLNGNIGIYRTKTEFRVLALPIDVKRGCHVASTFHVKPLFSWMQWDSEFLLLGIQNDSAHLYCGSQKSFRKIDSILYPNSMTELLKSRGIEGRENLRELKELCKQTFSWMSDWIEESASRGNLKLFVAGESYLTDQINRGASHNLVVRRPIAPFFSEDQAQDIVQKVRLYLLKEARTRLEQALITFRIADEMNLTQKSIREIARAVVQGRVRKLMIAENREVFGRLNPKTGKLALHPFDMDHEDDDLLDDLAQRVLISGGEVYVAKKEEIPGGKPILAILEEEQESVSMRTKSNKQHEIHQRGTA